MNYKLIVYISIVQSLQWTLLVDGVKNINLSYHYEKEGKILKPVCIKEDEYVVPEGEEVVINVKGETMAFAQCTFQYNMSFPTVDNFQTCCDSNVYYGKLKYVMSEPYNCTFYVLKEEGKRFEPTETFNNINYVRVSCIFKIKLYHEKPILLTAEVNGDTLIPSRKSIDNIVKSEYKYDKGQKFMVICKKRDSTKGVVDLTVPEITQPTTDSKLPITRAQFEINNPRLLGPYFTMRCRFHDNNNTLEVYNIDFAPKRASNEIDVDGLSIGNIMENKDDNRFLYYKYTDIEEINLKCSMDCRNEYCLMEMWNNAKKVNVTQWIYGVKTELSFLLLLTPADNSSVIKCVGFRKPATEILTQYIYVTFLYIDGRIKGATRTLRPNACADGGNTLNTNINCTSDWPKYQDDSTTSSTQNTLQTTSSKTSPTTLPTTLPTTTAANPSQSSTAPDFPKNYGWLIASVILILAVIVLIVCLACARRRRSKHISQRPPQPLPDSVELNTFPSASNQEQHEYEEIPESITRPAVPNVRQLRRIPDMRLDRKNDRLIVKGKAIDLQKLLREAEYVETK